MSIFGWSYPAGAEFDPLAPYNQDDEPSDEDLENQDDEPSDEDDDPGIYVDYDLVRVARRHPDTVDTSLLDCFWGDVI